MKENKKKIKNDVLIVCLLLTIIHINHTFNQINQNLKPKNSVEKSRLDIKLILFENLDKRVNEEISRYEEKYLSLTKEEKEHIYNKEYKKFQENSKKILELYKLCVKNNIDLNEIIYFDKLKIDFDNIKDKEEFSKELIKINLMYSLYFQVIYNEDKLDLDYLNKIFKTDPITLSDGKKLLINKF